MGAGEGEGDAEDYFYEEGEEGGEEGGGCYCWSCQSVRKGVCKGGQGNLLLRFLSVAYGRRTSVPTSLRHAPQLWPTKAREVASSAATGTITRPQRMVLKTPQAVA